MDDLTPIIESFGDNVLPHFLRTEERMADLTAKQMVFLNNLVEARAKLNAKSVKPLGGDFIEMPNGEFTRVCHDWGDAMQLCEDGSYAMMWTGHTSFSGSLMSPVPVEAFTKTDAQRLGRAWFFADHRSGAHRGVYCKMPFQVWKMSSIELAPAWDYKRYAPVEDGLALATS